tara:strand:- start:90 stop:380 length:291 start_codon:yes stop_codon:yes gene_type:complete
VTNGFFFAETYSRQKYAEMGVDVEFVQDNHSLSRDVGTLRGLHFQAPPHAQGKLVRCGRGAFFDVAVDIRRTHDPSCSQSRTFFGCFIGTLSPSRR